MQAVPNPFVRGPSTASKGSLLIYPQSANIEQDVGVKGKLQVFCRLHLGAGLTESIPDKKGDRNPCWSQELSFRRETESDLIINLYTKNLITAPTYLCECRVNLSGVFLNRQVIVTPELVRKGNVVGSMKVLLKWEPDQPQYVQVQPPQFQFQPQPSPVYNSHMVYSQPPQQMFHPPVVHVAPMMGSGQYVAHPQGMYGQPQVISVIRIPPPHLQQQQQQRHNKGSFDSMVKKEVKKIIEEPSDPNLPEDQKCVICLDRKKAGAFYKCGHSCTCVTCGTEFIGKPCPICREHIVDFIKVFDS